MRVVPLLLLTVAVLTCKPAALSAQNLYVLYGFKIGQPVAAAKAEMGEPTQTHTFPDGFKAYIYQKKGHNIIIEADNTRPDLIWAVQIEGYENPSMRGLGRINLGSPISVVSDVLGPAEEETQTIDEITKKPIPDTKILRYSRRNVSLEIAKGRASSIKILYAPTPAASKDSPDLVAFQKAVKVQDYYEVCVRLSNQLQVFAGGKRQVIEKSCVGSISPPATIAEHFFGAKGLKSVPGETCSQTSMRVHDQFGAGPVFRCKTTTDDHELFFARSFEGWVLVQYSIVTKVPAKRGLPGLS